MKRINDEFNFISTKKSRNRILMSPMDTLMSVDGFANEFHVQHYGSKAYGGVGTIIVESTAITSNGKIRKSDLGLWKNEHIKGHQHITSIVKKAGAVIGLQLNHAGSKSELDDEPRTGVSTYYDYLPMDQFTLMTPDDIENMIEDFVLAAKRAKLAGYDFVELHAAHGYLLSQILHSQLNEVIKSDDILVRAKSIITIINRIKNEVKIPVGIRISFTDNEKNGMVVDDFAPFIKKIEPLVEYFNASSGETLSRTRIVEVMREAQTPIFRIPVGKKVKSLTTKPVFIASNIASRNDVNQVLAAGIDGAAVGRELIFNPNLVLNTLLKPDEISKELYHWNQNIWFNPADYAKLKEKLKNKK